MKRIATALALTLTVSLFVAEQASKASGRRNDPAAVRKAIEKSLPMLESIRVPFIEKTGCVSCHNNSLPAMAAGLDRPVSAEGACCSRQQDPALPDQGRGP